MVVMLSGDGGWSTLTEKVTVELNASGYSVVGWNSLKYFWHPRTPDAASADLAKIISHYVDAWGVDAVILVGYSMGADVLPALFNRLPAAQRTHVRSIVLLAPERATDYEFHLSGWLKRTPKDAVPIAPEMHGLRGDVRVVCVFGRDEADRSLCTQLDSTTPTQAIIGLPGGHHFNGDYEALARLIR
jgi:type IV secretory pathway VirJ component